MDASKLPLFSRGKSLLSDALSPATRRMLGGLLDDSETENHVNPNIQNQYSSPNHAGEKDNGASSPARRIPSMRRRSALSDARFMEPPPPNSKSLVQIRCNARPFRVQLAMEQGQVVVHGFERGSAGGKSGQSGIVERSGQVQVGDVFVGVNGTTDALTSLEAAQTTLANVELPVVLTFRRVAVTKATLGEYTQNDIARHLMLCDSVLASLRGVEEAALLVRGCIDAFDEGRSTVPLLSYVSHIEQVVLPSLSSQPRLAVSDKRQRFEQIKQVMEAVHRRVDTRKKDQIKTWNAAKSSNYRRIEILVRQRASIKEKLERMRENRKELRPENHAVWGEYIELRHLSSQLSESIEKSKQEHFLPDFEGYSLRFGSDGVYVGVGDVWIPSFHAKFTIETRSTAPHLFFHISTPSTNGLKLRANNFKLATEGRLPSFHCDELNVEAQLIADIPLVFDPIAGWTVPPDELDVKLMSFLYYERQANSTKRGKDHDTVMKMFINRLLPSVVRHAVQRLFCVELGPLIEHRDAQVVLSGEIKISGRKLALYDAALNNPTGSSKRSTVSVNNQDQSEMAREMMAISGDEADVLYTIFKTFQDAHNSKKALFGMVETPQMCIRNLISYFEQFDEVPHLKALVCELWGQSVQLLAPDSSNSPSPRDPSVGISSSPPFATIINTIEQIKEYPVDVSISLVDVTFRLDLCEGAATYYMALQRIIRRKMDSSSVGLANLDALRDGTYLENKLTSLDNQYEKANRLLSYLTTNVDVLGVIFRGALQGGVTSKLFVEAHDFTCKGPCAGSITIPLTDFGALSARNGVEVDLESTDESQRSVLTRSHENGALVLSKFFLQKLQDSSQGGEMELPSDRLKVSVKNPSIRVLFEVPSDVSQLQPGQIFAPFELTMVTNDPTEPPKLKVETGDFGKCQYKAERVTMSGTLWQFLTRTRESTDQVLSAQAAASGETPSSDGNTVFGTDDGGPSGDDALDSSIWEEYLESSFFSLRFHFFSSCQVTRDHIFLSTGSASLTEPKVAQLKHRVCLGQLLQDLGMLSVVDSEASRRKAGARFQHALHQKATAGGRRGPPSISNYSRRQTLFSETSVTDSTKDVECSSEPMSLYETESNDGDGGGDGESQAQRPLDANVVESPAESESMDSQGAADQMPPPIRVALAEGNGVKATRERQKSAVFF
ncbi:hypothetical protein BBJ28_00005372 [Nothophytophthora sp. Chile5]|nr:hypothetical protein BBJ28_00005372 [Nothophytophthora sp. Chile5]